MKNDQSKNEQPVSVGSMGGSACVRTMKIKADEYNGEYGQYGIGIAGRMLSFEEAEEFAHRILKIVEKHKLSWPNAGDVARAGNGAAPKEKNNL